MEIVCMENTGEEYFLKFWQIYVQIFSWKKLALTLDEFFLLQELFKIFRLDF